MTDVSDMRREYDRGALRRGDLNPNALAQFETWFEEARKAGLPEPNAMFLATSGNDGRPGVRTVLLKYYDDAGFVFFTNTESDKAQQIADNPNVALLFYWQPLERQVVIRGEAEVVAQREVLRYFVKRPRDSQLGAWVSDQSRAISSRKLLELKLDEMRRRFVEGRIPLPSFWGGYRVRPRTIEFWQGRPNRLHDRFLYTRREDDWNIQRLAP